MNVKMEDKYFKRRAELHQRRLEERRDRLIAPSAFNKDTKIPRLRLGPEFVRTETNNIQGQTNFAGVGESSAAQDQRALSWRSPRLKIKEWNGTSDLKGWKAELDAYQANHEREVTVSARPHYTHQSSIMRLEFERHRKHGLDGAPYEEDRLLLHATGLDKTVNPSFGRIAIASPRPANHHFQESEDPTLLGMKDPLPVRARGGHGRHLISNVNPFGGPESSTNPLAPSKPSPPPPRCTYDPLNHKFISGTADTSTCKVASTCPFKDPMHVHAHVDREDERLPSGRLRGRYKSHGSNVARGSSIGEVLAHN